MCGICGELSFTERPVAPADVQAMAGALVHRGPDDAGLCCDGPIGLGHRRLSIIDLSPNGRQPMWTADGSLGLVFNGEVYNFREIGRDLCAKGYRFASSTDSEVVLNAIHCWGLDRAVDKFIGMFAFALWDARRQVLSLCRDRAGIKPLLYHLGEGAVLFASEMKALLAHPRFRRELDARGVAQYFILGYFLDDATAFARTFKVRPGCIVEIDREGASRSRCYWSLDRIERGSFAGSFDEAAERLTELCDSAFDYRLIADVPVGVFLSGGIDSSFLAAVVKKRLNADLLHITIGFGGDGLYDESAKASQVARDLGVRHMVRHLDAREAQATLLRFPEIYDEPFGDTSGIPTYILAKIAREHVTVALSADGGDEQFCGYESYPEYRTRYGHMLRVPGFLRRGAAAALGGIPYRWWLSRQVARRNGAVRKPQIIARYEKMLELLKIDGPGDLLRVMNEKAWTEGSVSDVLCTGVTDALKGSHLVQPFVAGTRDALIDSMMRADYTNFLADDILVKVDRASMAVSLECRDPFLDHRLAEFAFSLPLSYLYGPAGHKRIVKHLLKPWVSESVLAAPKWGFTIPLYDWLRGPWRPLVSEYLAPERIRAVGVIDERALEREVRDFYRYEGGRAEKIMTALIFQMWAERWYLR